MNDFFISTDKDLLDIEMIHNFLTESYWSKNIPKTVVTKAINNSLCFGIYTKKNKQVGFARLITDFATFSYLADVFVLPNYRNKGLSKMLLTFIDNYSELQNLRRMMLATKDAHELYKQFGYTSLNSPEIMMEKHTPDIYL